MSKIRHFEQRVYYLFLEGLVPGTVHLSTGQEAVAAGVCSCLRKDDFIMTTHRPHGHFIAKGGEIRKLMAEILGKETGCCKGKGGSMHICDFSAGIPPANAIVGANVPISAGIGLSFKLRKTDQVVSCFFGDGSVNQGMWHEGVNIAAIWKLPLVLVCENNLYAASTSIRKVMLTRTIAERACSYGIPSVIVDGNDATAVYEETNKAVSQARKGGGPTLLECLTYRHGGHSRGDPAHYRPEKEVEMWLKNDPIQRFRSMLLEKKILTDGQIREMEKRIIAEIEEAVKYAEDSPFPKPETALEDVYA